MEEIRKIEKFNQSTQALTTNSEQERGGNKMDIWEALKVWQYQAEGKDVDKALCIKAAQTCAGTQFKKEAAELYLAAGEKELGLVQLRGASVEQFGGLYPKALALGKAGAAEEARKLLRSWPLHLAQLERELTNTNN